MSPDRAEEADRSRRATPAVDPLSLVPVDGIAGGLRNSGQRPLRRA
jgi:hypothetical protein